MILAALTSGCSGPSERSLIVDLATDLRPRVEFDRIELTVFAGAGGPATGAPARTLFPMPADLETEARRGVRLAEIHDLSRGSWLVRARLSLADRAAGEGRVLVDLRDGTLAATIRVTRDCAGLECPGDGPPTHTACLAGDCLDPRCSPETPDFCPPPECGEDAVCAVSAGSPSCARGICLAGACGTWLDDSLCDGGTCGVEGCDEILCPPGTDRESPGSECQPILCGEDERVQAHVCVPCPGDSTRGAGDDASEADTRCQPSCASVYGSTAGFAGCRQTPTECELFADLMDRSSCVDVCEGGGGVCLATYNNVDAVRCAREGDELPCGLVASTLICVCSRPST